MHVFNYLIYFILEYFRLFCAFGSFDRKIQISTEMNSNINFLSLQCLHLLGYQIVAEYLLYIIYQIHSRLKQYIELHKILPEIMSCFKETKS